MENWKNLFSHTEICEEFSNRNEKSETERTFKTTDTFCFASRLKQCEVHYRYFHQSYRVSECNEKRLRKLLIQWSSLTFASETVFYIKQEKKKEIKEKPFPISLGTETNILLRKFCASERKEKKENKCEEKTNARVSCV